MHHPAHAADGSTAAQGGGNERPLHSRRLETTAAQGSGTGRRPLKTETNSNRQQRTNTPQRTIPPTQTRDHPCSGWCDRKQGRRRRWDGRKKWGGTAPRFGGDSEEKTKPACGTPGWVESLAHLPPKPSTHKAPSAGHLWATCPGHKPTTSSFAPCEVRPEAAQRATSTQTKQ